MRFLVLILFATVASAQPSVPRTPNLHLKFTSDAIINDNFAKLDGWAGRQQRGIHCLEPEYFGAVNLVNGSADDAAAVNAAIASLSTAGTAPGGCIHLRQGIWNFTTPVGVPSNVSIIGDGPGNTVVVLPSSGTGFAAFQVADPRTCDGGSGDATTCDDTFGGGTRGPGCVCHINADCQSNACTGGTQVRRAEISNMRIFLLAANQIAIDAALMNQSLFDRLYLFAQVNDTTYGIVFSDANAEADCDPSAATGCGGYSNTLVNSILEGGSATIRMEYGILVQTKANDTRILNNDCRQFVGTCLTIEQTTNATHVIDNHFQSAVTRLVSVDGTETFIENNRFEDTNSPNLVIGANATKVYLSSHNYFSGGAGGKVTDVATLSGGLSTATVNGIPGPTDSPGYACNAGNLSRSYWDLSTWADCVCQNATTPAFGLNATAATCGTTSTTTTTTTTTT